MQRRYFTRLLLLGIFIWGLPKRSLAMVSIKKTGLIYSELFTRHWLGYGHPESPDRLYSIMEKLETSGLLMRLDTLQLKSVIAEELYAIHTEEHLHQLTLRYPQSNEVALAAVGGILSATDAVCSGILKNAFCATRPPGHHANNTGRVEGFCFYNGVAVAARYAQHKYNLRKVLIVDWDYHHGNGTETSFYADSSILFFSTHDYHAYPYTGDPDKKGSGDGRGLNINVHLPCGAKDQDIIAAFNEKLLPVARLFQPELIIISAGFDSRQGDLLGCFDITDQGYRELTLILMRLAEQYCDGRIISVLEGGYSLAGLASASHAHIDTLLGPVR